ncbi:hypothetical protein IE81DRAFT_150822 [Ceraceosorus guamensis]|uniref:Uncharacterized protein n=1 Tax=Ceraceosorus guamensis TaxID=1522189 RepID=A0A316VX14_9BASI|nr:hypothetical protein IE81DRAFT_150822 [Ceraceosorus guamensis]PWN41999.1 hypothetical protein IE81DRAFT_150822 [Ceraceosorus guamensis]
MRQGSVALVVLAFSLVWAAQPRHGQGGFTPLSKLPGPATAPMSGLDAALVRRRPLGDELERVFGAARQVTAHLPHYRAEASHSPRPEQQGAPQITTHSGDTLHSFNDDLRVPSPSQYHGSSVEHHSFTDLLQSPLGGYHWHAHDLALGALEHAEHDGHHQIFDHDAITHVIHSPGRISHSPVSSPGAASAQQTSAPPSSGTPDVASRGASNTQSAARSKGRIPAGQRAYKYADLWKEADGASSTDSAYARKPPSERTVRRHRAMERKTGVAWADRPRYQRSRPAPSPARMRFNELIEQARGDGSLPFGDAVRKHLFKEYGKAALSVRPEYWAKSTPSHRSAEEFLRTVEGRPTQPRATFERQEEMVKKLEQEHGPAIRLMDPTLWKPGGPTSSAISRAKKRYMERQEAGETDPGQLRPKRISRMRHSTQASGR